MNWSWKAALSIVWCHYKPFNSNIVTPVANIYIDFYIVDFYIDVVLTLSIDIRKAQKGLWNHFHFVILMSDEILFVIQLARYL